MLYLHFFKAENLWNNRNLRFLDETSRIQLCCYWRILFDYSSFKNKFKVQVRFFNKLCVLGWYSYDEIFSSPIEKDPEQWIMLFRSFYVHHSIRRRGWRQTMLIRKALSDLDYLHPSKATNWQIQATIQLAALKNINNKARPTNSFV